MGASAGLAALVLVFLGLLATIVQGKPIGTQPAVLKPYRVVGGLSLGAFVLSLGSTGLTLWWLAGTQSAVLYWMTVASFVASLILLTIVAGWAYRTQIWSR